MKPLVAALTLAVICLAGAVGYLVWDREADDKSEPTTRESTSSPTETTTALDAPRYTEEEVVAKIMNHGFEFENYNGETERSTVQQSVNQTVCGEAYGRYPVTLVDFSYYVDALKEGARPCESETSAIYEGNGRWTISIAFAATEPRTARFSLREDTGEIIALDIPARVLINYGD
jgi:hypothetical protein